MNGMWAGAPVQEAVETEKVEVMTVTVGTQRRAVLEAIAFGSFLRDIETHIDSEYRLLTPSTSGCPPPPLHALPLRIGAACYFPLLPSIP